MISCYHDIFTPRDIRIKGYHDISFCREISCLIYPGYQRFFLAARWCFASAAEGRLRWRPKAVAATETGNRVWKASGTQGMSDTVLHFWKIFPCHHFVWFRNRKTGWLYIVKWQLSIRRPALSLQSRRLKSQHINVYMSAPLIRSSSSSTRCS